MRTLIFRTIFEKKYPPKQEILVQQKTNNVYIQLQQFNNMKFQAYSTQVISVGLRVNFCKSQSNYLQQFRSKQ